MLINKIGGTGIDASKIAKIKNKIKNMGVDPNDKGGASPTKPGGIDYTGLSESRERIINPRKFSILNDDDISDTFSFQDMFSANARARGMGVGFGKVKAPSNKAGGGLGFGNAAASDSKKTTKSGSIGSSFGWDGKR